MKFELTILGSNSALPSSTRYTTAQVLNVQERFFLIDCGEGTQIQLRRFKLKFNRINHIFLSHMHGDHVLGLYGLLSSFNLLGRETAVHIYAHPTAKNLIDHFLNYFAQDISYEIILHPFGAGRSQCIYEDKKVTVHTIPLQHRIPTVGFLFSEKPHQHNLKKDAVKTYGLSIAEIHLAKLGMDIERQDGTLIENEKLTIPPYAPRKYAFCSDTRYTEKIIPLVSKADILYHEATFLHDKLETAHKTFHSTAKEAANLARMADVDRLLIGHFSSRYKDIGPLLYEAQSVFPNTVAVNDGDVFSIGLKRDIQNT
jgi:ribonuclease Z